MTRRRVLLAVVERRRAVRGDLAAELAEQPRVAADRAMAVAADRGRRVGRERGGSAATAPRGVSGCGCSTVAERTAPSRLSRSDGRVGVVGAGADSDQQRQVLDPPRQVGEDLERGRSAHCASSTTSASGRARPAPSTARARCGRSASSRRRRAPCRSSSSSPAGAARPSSRRARSALGRVAHRRLQQRAHDAEREVALQRPGRGAAHEAAGLAPRAARVLEQRRLAEARGGLEDDDAAAAAGQARHRGAQHIELDRALDQRRSAPVMTEACESMTCRWRTATVAARRQRAVSGDRVSGPTIGRGGFAAETRWRAPPGPRGGGALRAPLLTGAQVDDRGDQSSASGSTVTESRPSSVLIRSVSLTPSLPAIVVCAARPVVSTCEPERVTRTRSARFVPLTVTVSAAASPLPSKPPRSTFALFSVGAGQVVDRDGVAAAQGPDVEALDVVEVHRDGGDVAGQAHARAVGGDVDVLGGVGAVEAQGVAAALAFDGVAAVARIPLEAVVAGAQQRGVRTDVAVDEVVAGAAEQRDRRRRRRAACHRRRRRRASGGSASRCRSGR